ncbi:MAG: tandem-95 repeat protein, partial [Planctomycetota bacterium]
SADYESVFGTLTTVSPAEAGPGGVLTNDHDPEQQPLTANLISGPSHAASFTLNPNGSFDYHPLANWTGTDSFTYSVSDGATADGPITVNIVVTPVNDAPSAITLSSHSLAGQTPAAVVGTVTVTDVDAGDAHSLDVSDSRFEIVGSVLQLRAGISVDPAIESNVTLTINATDSSGATFSQTVVLNVDNTNLAPSAQAGGPYSMTEGDSITLSAVGSSDPENSVLTYNWDLDGDGSYDDAGGRDVFLTWAQLNSLPTPINDDGTRDISVRVTDAGGLAATATTTLTVSNAAPVVTLSGPATATSGTPYTLNLSAADPGNDTITTWRINWGDGPTEDVSGALRSVSHTYQKPGGTRTIQVWAIDEDGTHPASSGPLTISVNNTSPSALSLSSTTFDGNRAGAVVGNLTFTDPDFGDSHAISVSDTRFIVVGGVLKLASGQTINPATEPSVNLSISVSDSAGASTTAAFTLNVNTPPVGHADSYTMDGTRGNFITAENGLLNNDADPDGPSTQAVLWLRPSHSQAFGVNANGSFWYEAINGYYGADSFTYRVFDGRLYSEVVTVSLMVNQPGSLSFTQTAFGIDENVKLTDRMKIGQLTITDDGIGTNTITLSGGNARYFELDETNNLYLKKGVIFDYEKTQTVTVKAQLNDVGIGGTQGDSSDITVEVRDRNDAPKAKRFQTSVDEDFGATTISVTSSFSDQDNDTLTYQIKVDSLTLGPLTSLTINEITGELSLQSAANQSGTVFFDVIATDRFDASATAACTMIVKPVNDAPTTREYFGRTGIGQSHLGSLITVSTDVENSKLTFKLVTSESIETAGTVTMNEDGTFLYTPQTGFVGSTSFQFSAYDGTDWSSPQTATIEVIAPITVVSGNAVIETEEPTRVDVQVDVQVDAQGGSRGEAQGHAQGHGQNAGTPSGSTSAPTAIAPSLTGGETRNMLNAENEEEEEEEVNGVIATSEARLIEQLMSVIATTDPMDDQSMLQESMEDNDHGRRGFDISTPTFRLNSALGLFTSGSRTVTLQQRELLYQTLIDQNAESVTGLDEKIHRKFSISDQVVGSVEVVTTVSSVGYLIWNAVRGGMLLSSLMAQIPAWNMLDPL